MYVLRDDGYYFKKFTNSGYLNFTRFVFKAQKFETFDDALDCVNSIGTNRTVICVSILNLFAFGIWSKEMFYERNRRNQ